MDRGARDLECVRVISFQQGVPFAAAEKESTWRGARNLVAAFDPNLRVANHPAGKRRVSVSILPLNWISKDELTDLCGN